MIHKLNNSIFSVLFLSLIVLSMSSCDMFKPAQDPTGDKVYKEEEVTDEIKATRRYNPETGEFELVQEVTTPMDTVKWRSLPENKYPPITSDGEYTDISTPTGEEGIAADGSVLKGSYNVAMLMPFNTQYSSAEKIDKRSKWAVNYYAGATMAVDVLRNEGINLKIDVFDTKGQETTVTNMLSSNESVQNADALIGPYRRVNVNRVAQWGKENGKVIVSPFSASMNLTRDNPNYIQVNPSIKSHVRAIVNHAMERYSEEDMLIVARNESDERQLATYMQEAKAEYTPTAEDEPIKSYIVESNSADFNELEIAEYINSGGTTVILAPSYKSEPFVYALLRKLYIAKKPADRIVVYGLPSWENFERIDFDYYENLNVHISTANFVDNSDPDVRLFKDRFFEKWGTPPSDEAVLGYDVLLFTGRMLKKYGTKFQLSLEKEGAVPLLHTTFDFERILVDEGQVDDSKMDKIDQFENKYVHILKFDNFYFQPTE